VVRLFEIVVAVGFLRRRRREYLISDVIYFQFRRLCKLRCSTSNPSENKTETLTFLYSHWEHDHGVKKFLCWDEMRAYRGLLRIFNLVSTSIFIHVSQPNEIHSECELSGDWNWDPEVSERMYVLRKFLAFERLKVTKSNSANLEVWFWFWFWFCQSATERPRAWVREQLFHNEYHPLKQFQWTLKPWHSRSRHW